MAASPATPSRADARRASPLTLLAASLLMDVLAGWLIIARHPRIAGLAALVGGLGLLAGTAAARSVR